MIDIHSHVLPGVDDGAAGLGESLAMLRLAAASGTKEMVATPHANAQYPFDEAKIESAFRTLSAEMAGEIRLHLGCELRLDYGNLRDALRFPQKYTIDQGRYLLLELPDLIGAATVRSALRELGRAGLVAVIAHPERNRSLQMGMKDLAMCVEEGALLQITGQSVLGVFGNRAQQSAEELLKAGLAHFIASDTHDCKRRTPDLRTAYEHVATRYGAVAAENLFVRNAAAILAHDGRAGDDPEWRTNFSALFRAIRIPSADIEA